MHGGMHGGMHGEMQGKYYRYCSRSIRYSTDLNSENNKFDMETFDLVSQYCISHTTFSNCTAIYCTILLFEYALITIRETASFSKGCSRVCLLGLHAATLP